MENKLKKAKVKSTGNIVEVYKLNSGLWCNYADCTTTYKSEDLDFLN